MRIKICGITSWEDAMKASRFGADALGFNFADDAKRTQRYIEPDAAREIVDSLPPFITTVAVTVNAPSEAIEEYLSFLDCVQLHGEEPPEVAGKLGRRAIKAIRLRTEDDLESIKSYHGISAILIDAFVEDTRGGTGKTCDWDLATRAVSLDVPIILAGGLTPENVGEAIQRVRPYGVDVASGVESKPGKKDHERLRAFIDRAEVSLSR